MATLAKLVVKLITDATEFTSGMEQASKQLGKIGQSMSSAGDKMTLGVTLPIVAAGVAAVKFASDLEETRNKTEVVFGDMSQTVFDFADGSARSMGMSENAALAAAATFGNLFTSMGMGRESAAEMSTGLVQLASDLASFNNLNPEEVFIKLQSGIVGEVEPLRALGINLSAVAVEAKAMQMGLVDAGGELSEQAKIAARYAIIMEQTGNAQGDFARTSDGLANSTRILKAQLEDTMASFGEELIPAVTTALNALIPILEFFNNLPQPVKQGIVYILMFAAAMGPILAIGGRLLGLFGLIAGMFGSGGALAGAAGWFSGTLVPAIAGAGVAIKAAFAGVAGVIGGISVPVLLLVAAIGLLIFVLIKFGPAAANTVSMVAQIFAAGFERIKFEIMKWMVGLAAAFTRGYEQARDAGKNIIYGIWEGIVEAWDWLLDNVSLAIQNLLDWINNAIGAHSPATKLKPTGKFMALGIGEGFVEGMSTLGFKSDLQPAGITASASAVRPATAERNISVGPITINGDLSKSAKERLRREIEGMFAGTLTEALR